MKARTIGIGAGIMALALAAGGITYVQTMRPTLELGVGYAARVACGCRYIGNRSLADCQKDFEPGMEPIRLSEDVATKSITASVPLIASRTVRYTDALACQPEPFSGTVLNVKH
jgi:hypothetical protein